MKTYYILYIIYILNIIFSPLFISNKKTLCDFLIINSYIFIVILSYYIYKYRMIKLITRVSYYSDFDCNNNYIVDNYLKYIYKLALILFGGGSVLTIIFKIIKAPIFIDISVFIILLFIWTILGYRYSKKISNK